MERDCDSGQEAQGNSGPTPSPAELLVTEEEAAQPYGKCHKTMHDR